MVKQFKASLIGLSVAFFISACGGGGGDTDGPNSGIPDDDPNAPVPIDLTNNTSCDVDVQNQWVYNNMQDYYLFYDQVPNINPQSFDSPEELLRAVRFEERDPFSSLTDAATSTLQFEAGREFGLGYGWARDNNGIPRIVIVEPNSPFGLAGVERGDIIVDLNGIAWNEFPNENFVENIFGTPDAPATSVWDFRRRNTGELFRVEVTTTEYQITTVMASETLTHPSYNGTLGYLLFTRFLETSVEELQSAFTTFSDRGVTDLVVDLRYNSGGRVSTAQFLASLLGGSSRSGELLYQYEYNDKYTFANFDLRTLNITGDLGLTRLIFLTQGRTASASEIVISGLSPHMEVLTMGSTTSGKPYIQSGRNRCGQQLNAIEAEGFNAAGVSVFGGIPADCIAIDDRTRNFGFDPETRAVEGMLETALDYLLFGTCDVQTIVAKQTSAYDNAQSKLLAEDENAKQGIVNIGGAFH